MVLISLHLAIKSYTWKPY